MLEKLRLVEERYMEMAERAGQPDFYADPKAASKLLREQKRLEPIVTAYRSFCKVKKEADELREMLDAGGLDAEMKALCQEEYTALKKQLEELEQELKILLLPRDPNDDKSVIVEIRGGVGGEESALFAHSLYRMYTMYAQSKGWKVTLLNYNETELGGVKEADFEIDGDGAYSRLKFESGVHRVQRVPETESGGRVHTSTATVAVLPEMEEAEVDIRPEDIEMQVFRSSGAGGQHINKTSSAVRLIHKPSGIVVSCQEERSQVQNREKCMQMLASKLYEIEQERISSAVTNERRSQVGTGMRNERIRTVQRDFSGVGDEASRNCTEKRRLARAVCADNGDEVARADMERDIVERKLCVLGAGIEGFRDVCDEDCAEHVCLRVPERSECQNPAALAVSADIADNAAKARLGQHTQQNLTRPF